MDRMLEEGQVLPELPEQQGGSHPGTIHTKEKKPEDDNAKEEITKKEKLRLGAGITERKEDSNNCSGKETKKEEPRLQQVGGGITKTKEKKPEDANNCCNQEDMIVDPAKKKKELELSKLGIEQQQQQQQQKHDENLRKDMMVPRLTTPNHATTLLNAPSPLPFDRIDMSNAPSPLPLVRNDNLNHNNAGRPGAYAAPGPFNMNNGNDDEETGGGRGGANTTGPTTTTSSTPLAVAIEVQETPSSLIPQASPSINTLAGAAKKRKLVTAAPLVVLLVLPVAVVAVAVPLAIFFTARKVEASSNEAGGHLPPPAFQSPSTNTSSGRPLPPVDNLELLYNELPDRTRESLYNTDSPQYQAWEWLLGHRNVTHLEEWRKKQIFALTAFFYAFEGPLWPEVARNNWLNDTLHECSWMKTNVQFGMVGAGKHLQTTEYHPEDFLQCNDKGQVHLISLIYLQLGGANPFVPPEIGLLSSLVQFGACCNELDAPLQDMMPIEMSQLPKLKSINLAVNNLHGTIPQCFLQFKALKHLLLARNALTGTIPNEVGSGTENQMKVLFLNHNSLTGSLPSELTLLTSMTNLLLRDNLVSGTIPSEIWSMANLSILYVGENHFTGNIPAEVGNMVGMEHLDMKECGFGGSIPSQIGLATDMKRLWLSGNSLTGSMPHELTLMTDAQLLWLHDNHISGNIPEELWQLSQMRDLDLSSLPLLAGTVPEELCCLQRNESCIYQETLMVPDDFPCHLDFDCTEWLCGCDCQCP